jgi:MFS family permease
VLVGTLGWRSIFWVNVPIGAAAVILTARYVPESRAERPRRPDWPGQALIIALFATLTFGVIEGPDAGWDSPRILAAFAAAALALAALTRYEPRRREPLIDLRLFRSVSFSGAVVVAVCAYVSLGGLQFVNTLYLQEARGMSALDAGLRTLPMAIMTMVGAVTSGGIVAARGARLPLVTGGAGIAAAAGVLTGLTTTTSYAWLIAAYFLFGAGFGMLNAPITNTAVSGLPPAQAGLAGGIASTSRQLGQSLGVAVAGAITAAAASGDGGAWAELAIRSHPVWWVILACGVAIAVVGCATAGGGRQNPAAESGSNNKSGDNNGALSTFARHDDYARLT